MSNITLNLQNEKYTFIKNDQGLLTCNRYGEPWREFLGDKAVAALFDYAIALRNLSENLQPGPISEALGGAEHERPYRMAANPNATLDLNLIHEALQTCKVALPVLRNLCKHANLNAGVARTEEVMAELDKAIAEAERFAKEVRG